MNKITSLSDLKQLREDIQSRIKLREKSDAPETLVQIKVGMATCGIASGAKETMNVLIEEAERQAIDVVVTQTGCIGKCDYEPIVAVTVGAEPKVTYGHINPERARKIMQEHVAGGKVLSNWVVPE